MLMLKKILAFTFTAVIALSFSACDKKDGSSEKEGGSLSSVSSSDTIPEDFMRSAAKELTALAQMSAKEISAEDMGLTDEEISSLYSSFAEADLSNPEKITVYSMSKNQINSYMQLSGFSEDSLSDEAYSSITKKVLGSIGNMINGKAGSTETAAGSVLGASKAFPAPEGFEGSCFMIVSWKDFSAAVSFSDEENGCLLVQYTPVFTDRDTIDIILTQSGLNETKQEISAE